MSRLDLFGVSLIRLFGGLPDFFAVPPEPTKPANDANVLKTLEERLQRTERGLTGLEIGVNANRFAILTPGDTGFQMIDTGVGTSVIALRAAETSLNGVNVDIDIGWLISADGGSYSLDASWGKLEARRNQKYEFPTRLFAGHWNRVRMFLPETKPDEVGDITVQLIVKTLYLR